jgi:hypothetical protein
LQVDFWQNTVHRREIKEQDDIREARISARNEKHFLLQAIMSLSILLSFQFCSKKLINLENLGIQYIPVIVPSHALKVRPEKKVH